MKKIKYNLIFFHIIILMMSYKFAMGNETYFDLSDQEIEIQTNFNGKEVIIFGLTDSKFDTIVVIKGPYIDTKISKKERLLGFWFNAKRMIYKDLPSVFFVASSSPINEILEDAAIIKKGLYFDQLLSNLVRNRNFNFTKQNKPELWNKNLIKIKKQTNYYKEYDLKIIDNKLFQTKIFFPSTAIPGEYDVNIYQIFNKIIVSEKSKKITLKKAGIGDKIFNLAHEQPAAYGIICIIFAIFAGLSAATIFRRL